MAPEASEEKQEPDSDDIHSQPNRGHNLGTVRQHESVDFHGLIVYTQEPHTRNPSRRSIRGTGDPRGSQPDDGSRILVAHCRVLADQRAPRPCSTMNVSSRERREVEPEIRNVELVGQLRLDQSRQRQHTGRIPPPVTLAALAARGARQPRRNTAHLAACRWRRADGSCCSMPKASGGRGVVVTTVVRRRRDDRLADDDGRVSCAGMRRTLCSTALIVRLAVPNRPSRRRRSRRGRSLCSTPMRWSSAARPLAVLPACAAGLSAGFGCAARISRMIRSDGSCCMRSRFPGIETCRLTVKFSRPASGDGRAGRRAPAPPAGGFRHGETRHAETGSRERSRSVGTGADRALRPPAP